MPRVISGLDWIRQKGQAVRSLKPSTVLENDTSLEDTFGIVGNNAIPKYSYAYVEIQTFISLLAKAGMFETARAVAGILESIVKSVAERNSVKRGARKE